MQKKTRRLPDGTVMTGPSNFITKPAKKGAPNSTPGVTFDSTIEYSFDHYDRKQMFIWD